MPEFFRTNIEEKNVTIDIKADKHELAEQIALFVSNHGVEEAGKLLSRFLLGLAHHINVPEIEFTDDMGRVTIEPTAIPEGKKH